MKNLIEIQQKLNAPKGQYNSFGKYKYRSCEDILEAVKPLLLANDCTLILSDTLENIGNRYYIKATAKLFKKDGILIAENTAFAREEEDKKGMDGSQITGASSSYARKYALNGLFLIDDEKDSDSTNDHSDKKPLVAQKGAEKEPEKWLNILDKDKNYTREWCNILDGVKEGKISTVADIRRYYKVSKEVAVSIEELLSNK